MKRRAALFLLAGAVVLAVAAGVAFAATVNCQVDIPCVGTDGADELYGTASSDEMLAGRGDDLLVGRRGRDELDADSRGLPTTALDGDDQAYGNRGRDLLHGYGGDDLLKGGSGDDEINAIDLFFFDNNLGEDTVLGDGGNDDIDAKNELLDTIDCGDGFDRVVSYDVGLDEITDCEILFPPADATAAQAEGMLSRGDR
jgi:Ca2+-binding RTX toxin-like protein